MSHELPGPSEVPLPPLPEAGELPERDGEELSFDRPERKPGIRQTILDSAAGHLEEEEFNRDARAMQDFVKKVVGSHPGGFLEVRREGPLGLLAATEYGSIGKIPLRKVRGKDVADVVRAAYGGGEFEIVGRDATHGVIPGGTFHLEIAGDPKPVSEEGIDERERRTARRSGGIGTGAREDVLRQLAERAPGGGGDTNALIMLMLDQQKAEREERAREQERRDREETRRREEERDERRKREADEKEERERKYREWRAEQDAAAARAAAQLKAIADENAQRHERQMAEDTRRHEMQLEAWKEERERVARAEKAKTDNDLGIGVLRRVKEQIAELVSDGVLGDVKNAGGDPDSPSGLGDAFNRMVAKDGGQIAGRLLDILGAKLGAPPAQVQQAPQALDVDVDVDGPPLAPQLPPPAVTSQAPAQAAPGDVPAATTTEDALRSAASIAQQKASQRPILFLRLLSSEIMAQGDAETAWETEQDDRGTNLASLFLQLPRPLREAFRSGWGKFAELAARAVPPTKGDISAINAVLSSQKGGKDAIAWVRAFRLSAPEEQDAPPLAQSGQPPNAPVGGPAEQSPEVPSAGETVGDIGT